jgi:hypothetical protein
MAVGGVSLLRGATCDARFHPDYPRKSQPLSERTIQLYSLVQNYWRITIFTLRVTLTTPKIKFFAQHAQTIEFHPSTR